MKDLLHEEWKHTVSGHIYTYMQNHFQNEAKIGIENLGGPIEIFTYDKDQAHIRKRETEGSIETCIESYEYKRLPWWKESIDHQQGVPFIFLDPPVMWVAKDAGISNWEELFRPSVAVSKYHIADINDLESVERAKIEVRKVISEIITPKVSSAYSIQFQDGGLRLIAETDEAMESRYIDNEVYNQVLIGFQAIAEPLQEQLQKMAS